jgi:predicted RND superfamily exporter protein
MDRLTAWYLRLTLDRPWITIVFMVLFTAVAVYYAPGFKLDASADSLMLENDQDLSYYRAIRGRYGSDDFLFITYTPKADILADATLADIKALRDELAALERISSVTSLLDVPLIDSPRMSFSEIRSETRTLEHPKVDRKLARKEFTQSRLYRNLLMSPDGTTTTLQVNFKRDKRYQELLQKREGLRAKRLQAPLTPEEQTGLDAVTREFKHYKSGLQEQERADISRVRAILDRHKDKAEIHLGGVPMVTCDMIDFIRNDIRVFGVGIALFLITLLAIAFKRPRWVILPMLICTLAGIGMVGYLGLVEWRVTVVSSNFISLMLILTLSLSVHLIVRDEELQHERPDKDHLWKVGETVKSKFTPSLFTALTTMVAFASLLFSDIRPVIDFGWMMVVGVGMAFVLSFLLFPAVLALLKPSTPVFRRVDVTANITRRFVQLIERRGKGTLITYGVVVILSVLGIFKLTVENSFIDYFKKTSEIYQGMLLIDQQVGGTTPLDVILNPTKEFLAFDPKAVPEDEQEEDEEIYKEDEEEGEAGISGTSFWFNVFELETVSKVHDYLEGLPQTGKVLSLDTTMALLTQLNEDKPMDNWTLAVMYKLMPEEVKRLVFDPYMTSDGNQMRFAVRIIDSDPELKRDALIKQIRSDLVEKLRLQPEQVEISGMLVLYNNVLQSLFRSQVLTLSVVFVAIMLMFGLLFRSVRLAAIGIVPTLVAAALILGMMGWLGIPLDIMTITIAAITIGIGVDDTIHYVHRIREEFALDGDYWAAVRRSHSSVGRAIYYTSVTITLGFSILALSNFIPSIYFGLLTGLAMVVALIANLTLLPLLIVVFKPLVRRKGTPFSFTVCS